MKNRGGAREAPPLPPTGSFPPMEHPAIPSPHDPAPGPRPAVVLLSGGLDSATALAVARRDGFAPCAMTFRYGQRHAVEIEAARRVAAAQGVAQHVVVDIDLRQWGGSALTDAVAVPKDRDVATADDIPVTYVPARNTIFLSFALAWAEVLGAPVIYVGVNALDYSGYPDCRPEYIAAFETMANLATKAGVEGTARLRIAAPLQQLTKAEIIRLGTALGVDYGLTTSCYDPAADGAACGRCDSCQLRRRGFAQAGRTDPIRYADAPGTG
jgi:7-cyano-7-deazaguanine synthase